MSGGYLRKLAVLLGDIARKGRTGTLRLDATMEVPARIRFSGGTLVSFTPSHASTQPGGHASGAFAGIRQDFLQAAIEIARREGASPEFQQDAPSVAPVSPERMKGHAGLNAADFAIDLCRKLENLAWIEDQVRSARGMVLRAANPPPAVQPCAALSAVEGFLLSRADGSLTMQQVLDTSPLGGPETMRALAALWLVGMVASPATRVIAATGGAGTGGTAGSSTPRSDRTAHASTPTPARRPIRTERLSDLDRFLKKTGPAERASGVTGPAATAPAGRGPESTGPIVQETLAGPVDAAEPSTSASAGSKYTAAQQKERDSLLQKREEFASMDHYSVLGVDRGADESAIRASYYRLARLYHPDRLLRPHLEDIHRELEGMFANITEAYNTLTDPAARTAYDRELSERVAGRRREGGLDRQALARDSYLRGRKEIEAGRVFEAMMLFENAVENDPGRAEYFHYLGACQGQNPRWRKKAEENLRRAIELNPGALASYIELARLYRKGGLERRSLEVYQQVLTWDPTNEEALAALGRGGPARGDGAPSSGLLRSLFKKD